jgi:hypothetical protein
MIFIKTGTTLERIIKLDDDKEQRGYSHLKEEALDRTMWRARFGRGFGPVVKQTTKLMNQTDLGQEKPVFNIREQLRKLMYDTRIYITPCF